MQQAYFVREGAALQRHCLSFTTVLIFLRDRLPKSLGPIRQCTECRRENSPGVSVSGTYLAWAHTMFEEYRVSLATTMSLQ